MRHRLALALLMLSICGCLGPGQGRWSRPRPLKKVLNTTVNTMLPTGSVASPNSLKVPINGGRVINP